METPEGYTFDSLYFSANNKVPVMTVTTANISRATYVNLRNKKKTTDNKTVSTITLTNTNVITDVVKMCFCFFYFKSALIFLLSTYFNLSFRCVK